MLNEAFEAKLWRAGFKVYVARVDAIEKFPQNFVLLGYPATFVDMELRISMEAGLVAVQGSSSGNGLVFVWTHPPTPAQLTKLRLLL